MEICLKIRAYLVMGRLSNLPTIWSNALVGLVWAGSALEATPLLCSLMALSCFYTGGMVLNDACDHQRDAQECPQRPIPRGLVSPAEAYGLAVFLLLAGHFILLGYALHYYHQPHWQLQGYAVLLSALIIGYNRLHHRLAHSPLLMAFCRLLAYVLSAALLPYPPPPQLWWAAGMTAVYVLGLAYLARQEHSAPRVIRWPLLFCALPLVWAPLNLPLTAAVLSCYILLLTWLASSILLLLRRYVTIAVAVGFLIAGICLWDALLLAAEQQSYLAGLAIGAWLLALGTQRLIPAS